MKKILLLGVLGALTWAGCKKKDDERVSFVADASRPTISFSGGEFYSINVGGSVPPISASAYDSTLGESYPVTILGAEDIDNTTPGLYVIQAQAKNKYGLAGRRNIYIAVTDAKDSVSLAGTYLRAATGAMPNITRLARGLYMTDDLGGAPTLPVTALFVRLSDTSFDVPVQPTGLNGTNDVGNISADNEKLIFTATDTTLKYIVRNGFFGTAERTFVKQ